MYQKAFFTLLLAPICTAAICQTGIRNIGGKSTSMGNIAKLPLHRLTNINYDFVRKPANWKPPTATNVVVRPSDKETVSSDGKSICKTVYRKLDVTSLSQDVLNPNDISSLTLGGIYALSEFKQGNINNIPNSRNAISLSIDGIPSIKVNEPTITNLGDGLTNLRNTAFKSHPTRGAQYYECKIANTVQELNLAAGISYSGFGFDVAANFGYNSSTKTNKYLVTYVNPIYTAKITDIQNPFTNAADNANGDYVILDKITYGCKLMIYFESTLDEETVKASFSGSGYGVKANGNVETKKALSGIDYKIFLYGSQGSIQTVKGWEQLATATQQMIDGMYNKNSNTPFGMGEPISYSLRFLNGDVAAANCNANELPSQVCSSNPNVPQDFTISLTSLTINGGNIFGWIDLEILDANGNRRGSDIKTVWNVNRDNATSQSAGNTSQPLTSVTFVGLSANDRKNGKLRIWTRLQNRQIGVGATDAFLLKASSSNKDEGMNFMHGEYKGQYEDFNLSDFMLTAIENNNKTIQTIRSSGNDKKVVVTVTGRFN